MLVDSGLPHKLWEYALQHATYIRNRIPRHRANVTPYQRVFGQRPDVSRLPIFGQAVVARVPDQIRRKTKRFVDTRGQSGAFIGCAEDIKDFYIYTRGTSRSIFASRDVSVIDRMLFEVDPNVENDDEITGSDGEGEEDDRQSAQDDREGNFPSELAAVRRSQRIARRTMIHAEAFLVLGEVIKEPLNLAESRYSPQWPQWKQAVDDEVHSLFVNGTFKWVNPPGGFRLKTGAAGNVERFQAGLCARGDNQVWIVQFLEAYAPVAGLVTVRVLFVIVASLKMRMRQGDVSSAYVKAKLSEEIYMKPVPGYAKPGDEGKVWRLRKALYGLRQAGREWNKEINAFLYAYVANSLLLVCIYVDDILVAQEQDEQCFRIMTALNQRY
ncbi:Reverse transcriptase, RNA-dependent DNA polymerase domain containing hypothetical protein [Phytophthora palmivora]|uniref:Reverse transcriptase Ty1/copia-type domain-containing protein n=1 Tax=Phytophthora palmivora TaxID=4796 RepID=A0A2P4XW93_9STRA|nr:Reverse transcriptase, RNA-dependent DNA polymerase domain containing hypothetical protein [Phytophthora palmivora]